MRLREKKRKLCLLILLCVSLFALFYINCGLLSNGFDTRKQRTIDFLRGASMNLKRYDIKNTTAQFPSISSEVCMIAKNGHAAIQYVSCLLSAIQLGDSKTENWLLTQSTYSGAFSHMCNNNLSQTWAKDNEESEKYVFIRDPLQRFVSGWLFVCKRHNVCFDCGLDLACFFTTLFNCWSTDMKHSKVCTYNPPNMTRDFIFFHISPQAIHCRLREKEKRRNYNFIDYSSDAVNSFLLKAAQPMLYNKQYDILNELLHKTSDHAATKKDAETYKRRISSDKNLAAMFAILYFVDYDTFSIDLPQFIVDLQLFNPDSDAFR